MLSELPGAVSEFSVELGTAYSVWDLAVLGLQLDSMALEGFSKLSDSLDL